MLWLLILRYLTASMICPIFWSDSTILIVLLEERDRDSLTREILAWLEPPSVRLSNMD